GYPREMVGLDQDLEADLGIDSIKRVEIVGELMKRLPESYAKALGDTAELNREQTLMGIIKKLESLSVTGDPAVPFDYAGTEEEDAVDIPPFRHVMVPCEEALDPSVMRPIEGGLFVLTEDISGISDSLKHLLEERGCKVYVVQRSVLESEELLNEWCIDFAVNTERVNGVIHLAPLSAARISPRSGMEEWRMELLRNEKSFFLILRNLYERLQPGAVLISASSMGGGFGRTGVADLHGLSIQGGGVGLLKSFLDEAPQFIMKAVDFDPGDGEDKVAAALLNEMENLGGRQEIGYADGSRMIFRTVPEEVDLTGSEGDLRDLVVLATGGGRGITAELLRDLALPGNVLILTGRRPMPGEEPEDTSSLATAAELRRYFISNAHSGGRKLMPAEIERKIRGILAKREMRNNMDDFRRRGATVHYYAVDVMDEGEMSRLFEEIRREHGSVNAVIHGAGIIEDKLLRDKTGDSWSRVVETKVMGLMLLQKYLDPESLKFFVVMSSVAGRYGNSGQTDYATANEIMNRICWQLSGLWGAGVKVRALCWGPWGATQFGAGMVISATEEKFAARGIRLVSAESGRRCFKEELLAAGQDVEVVCGEGRWEAHEAAHRELRATTESYQADTSAYIGPMLDGCMERDGDGGDMILRLDVEKNHIYLQEHCIDGIPVLPMAAALEIMSEAAIHAGRGRTILRVEECRMLHGIRFEGGERKVYVRIGPVAEMNGDGSEVEVRLLIDDLVKERAAYRARILLVDELPARPSFAPKLFRGEGLSVKEAYDNWLFHGPLLRVIEEIMEITPEGSLSLLRSSKPSYWLRCATRDDNLWCYDPALIDAAAQMAIIWARKFRDETALPARFGKIIRYVDSCPEKLFMRFERTRVEESHLVCADVCFYDTNGDIVLTIDDMECVSNAELNRLGSKAGRGRAEC
ncbi:MAG: SDR family NAD(P)-dependent oxidoreductase, partial [Deltaproteobacteria bacterium]|nr:SDR family NAD(P)-dependent oxidoreductase [Deltaproteobacteria bacterium]